MAKKKSYFNIGMARDAAIIFLSVIIAIYLAQSGAVHDILTSTKDIELLSAFVAGIFFVSMLTAAPAGVVLFELGETMNPLLLILAGGIGNIVGDYVMFYLFTKHVEPDIDEVAKHSPLKRMYRAFQRNRFLHWVGIVLGALIIASPFPDEIGITLMGASKVPRKVFLSILVVLDFASITLITLAAQAM